MTEHFVRTLKGAGQKTRRGEGEEVPIVRRGFSSWPDDDWATTETCLGRPAATKKENRIYERSVVYKGNRKMRTKHFARSR